ncbi:MAG: hypothetical protein BroJett025_02620 [Patescibacteria group bacterium]|nr:MAG: hypothetical protein BroJett025_02620 [Patescibacteria group bacterium]
MNKQKLGNQEAWDRVDLSAPKKRATIFINETLLRECKAQAALEGYSFSEIAEMSLELYLSQLAYTGKEAAGLKKGVLEVKRTRGKK